MDSAYVYQRHEYLRHYLVRLATLTNLYSDNFNCTKQSLASMGFYYEGYKSEVYCFSCNFKCVLRVSDENFEVFEKHRKNSSNCNFLNGLDISISSASTKLTRLGFSTVNDALELEAKVNEEQETFYDLDCPTIITNFYDEKRKSVTLYASFKIPSILNAANCLNINDFFSYMRYEKNRLKTFQYGIYDNSNLSPEKLSFKGFFYTLLNNIVQCAFCRLVIGGIEECTELDFDTIHLSKNKFCNTLTKNNIPLANVITENVNTINELINERFVCKICYTNEICILVLDCKHISMCLECSNNTLIKRCPYCRGVISNKIKVYIS
jgi:Inhibitor of Apoptosis domain/Zinc finger, C3HC4 type (RING finger)